MSEGLPWWAADFLRASRNGVEGRARGQVHVVPGRVQALVEGRGFRPTEVLLETPVLDRRRWRAFFEVFAGQALYPAALFAGYLPRSAKSVLARRGVRLVPPPSRLALGPYGCPAETLARALLLIAEHFAADPFRLLLFRGADRQSVIAGIARRWKASGARRPAIELDELREILDQPPDPESDSLLPAVQRAEAFRDDPILRGQPGPPLHQGLRARRRGHPALPPGGLAAGRGCRARSAGLWPASRPGRAAKQP